MPLLPGERLNDRYRIVELLAEGPYGAMYRAWDLRDQVHVAIKEYLSDEAQIQRYFREEARRLSRLNHPQLPAVRDHFALDQSTPSARDGAQYLISDYIDGVDLRQLLRQYGPLPAALIVEWLQAVAAPLTYLHEQGQLHLNIKPANIRVTPSGDVFLVDTGLPSLGVAPGGSGYASPEQQKQQPVTVASDIYSLGATLFTLLTDTAPPDALRRESGLVDLLSAREVNPDVEPYLALVASRALDLRPDVRYESAADFAQALNRPVGRPQPDAPRRTVPAYLGSAAAPRRITRRRRMIEQRTIFGLATVLLIMVGIVAGYLYATRPSTLPGGSVAAATATFESQVVAAITAIATPPTPTPTTTPFPSPTPGPIENETGSRMLYVPGGVFRMGNDDGERSAQPSHLVRINAYYIDETEVTNGEYEQCVLDGPCRAPANRGATYHPAYFGSDQFVDYPVIFVSWNDAQTFCEWRGARLPTEAEWEKAAGFDPLAFSRTLYPWGENFIGTLLNYCDANCGQEWADPEFNDGHRDTAPVGSYPDGRSWIGAADMLGNVAEWVSDWYDPTFYERSPEQNPSGPLEGDAKVIRGGSWFSRSDTDVASRGSFLP